MQTPVLRSCIRGNTVVCAQTPQCAVSGLSGTCGSRDARGDGTLAEC